MDPRNIWEVQKGSLDGNLCFEVPSGRILALGLHVYKYYLHWAPKSINMTYIELFGALG